MRKCVKSERCTDLRAPTASWTRAEEVSSERCWPPWWPQPRSPQPGRWRPSSGCERTLSRLERGSFKSVKWLVGVPAETVAEGRWGAPLLRGEGIWGAVLSRRSPFSLRGEIKCKMYISHTDAEGVTRPPLGAGLQPHLPPCQDGNEWLLLLKLSCFVIQEERERGERKRGGERKRDTQWGHKGRSVPPYYQFISNSKTTTGYELQTKALYLQIPSFFNALRGTPLLFWKMTGQTPVILTPMCSSSTQEHLSGSLCRCKGNFFMCNIYLDIILNLSNLNM